jgi:hypothetical protein
VIEAESQDSFKNGRSAGNSVYARKGSISRVIVVNIIKGMDFYIILSSSNQVCPKIMGSKNQKQFVALWSMWDSCRLNCEKECVHFLNFSQYLQPSPVVI